MQNAKLQRKKELAIIHMAKSDLGMSRDDYEFVLLEVTGKSSAADLDVREREKLIKHFKTKGFQIKSKKQPINKRIQKTSEGMKVVALWQMLHELGAVKNPSDEALLAYVKRITKSDAMQWINGNQTETLIETLKKWALRFLPGHVQTMAQRLSAEIRAGNVVLDEATIQHIGGYVQQAQIRLTFEPMHEAYEVLKEACMKLSIQEQQAK